MQYHKPILTASLLILVAGAFLVGGFAISMRSQKSPEEGSVMDDFSKCLTEKGAVMYGAYWCPHCQAEKKSFGDSFKFVNYVECTEETQKCLDEKIESYPTWIFADGRRLVGEQGIEKLAAESGCAIPR